MTETALVLFSGGQDSTTCLAWALNNFDAVETVGFDYGQRHAVELDCRAPIRNALGTFKPAWQRKLGEDYLLDLRNLGALSDTALTRERAITIADNNLPNTFVPGRNLLFFTYAAALAYRRGIKHLVGGMCETDYSGYPDCRNATLQALQTALNLGMDDSFTIHTPLMAINKAETWRLAETLGGVPLLDMIREATHSCYLGNRDTRHPWGYGCGTCPACQLRAAGYQAYMTAPQSANHV
jgi:7-cyano-7-deazaguanine synthase